MNLKEVSFKVNRNSQHTVAFYKIDTFGVNVRFFGKFFFSYYPTDGRPK